MIGRLAFGLLVWGSVLVVFAVFAYELLALARS